MFVEKQVANMEHNAKLILNIVIVIKIEANWSDRRMKDKARCGCKKYFCEININGCFLIFTLLDVFKRFEKVTIQPEIELILNGEYMPQPKSRIVEGSEIFQNKGWAILQRKKCGGVNDGAKVVAKKRLIRKYSFCKIPGPEPSFIKVMFGRYF